MQTWGKRSILRWREIYFQHCPASCELLRAVNNPRAIICQNWNSFSQNLLFLGLSQEFRNHLFLSDVQAGFSRAWICTCRGLRVVREVWSTVWGVLWPRSRGAINGMGWWRDPSQAGSGAWVLCWLLARLPSTLQDKGKIFLINNHKSSLFQKVVGAHSHIFTGKQPSLNLPRFRVCSMGYQVCFIEYLWHFWTRRIRK